MIVALFVYTFAIRIWGLTGAFWMHYDQIRDWRIALGPVGDAPLVGPVTHVGGNTLGPAFYWVLWALRVAVGPWFDYLPHAGGIGQALLHSIADAMLFAGIRARTHSTWLALAVVLLVASAPYDLALSRTIWNPMMAVTFAKMASALVLLGWADGRLSRVLLTAAVAWAAVQAHFAGLFVASAVLLYIAGRPALDRQWRTATVRALAVAVLIAALQIPWMIHWMRQPVGTEGTPVGESLRKVATGAAPVRLGFSVETLTFGISNIQSELARVPGSGWILLALALVTLVQWRHDPALLAVSVGPIAAVWLGFAVWQGGVHSYFYFSLMPAALLTTGLALTTWKRGTVTRVGAFAALVVALLVQPARLRTAEGIHRMPEYGPLLRGSRAIAARGQPMRRIQASFVAPTSDPQFLYEILGGRISSDAEWTAVIDPDGEVRYVRAPPALSR